RCRQALEAAPDDLSGIDMLAELLCEKGELEEARGLYHRALEIQPGRASAETALARITLELADRENERLMAQTILSGGSVSQAERKRRVAISLLLPFLFAGAGQLYNGEYVKGGILAGAYLLGLLFGATEVWRVIFGLMGAHAGSEPISEWRAVLGLLGFF